MSSTNNNMSKIPTYWISRWDPEYFDFNEALEKQPLYVKKRCPSAKPKIGDQVAIILTKKGGMVATSTVVMDKHEYYDLDPYETVEGKAALEGVVEGVELKITRNLKTDHEVRRIFEKENIKYNGMWSWKKITQEQYNNLVK